MSQIKNIAQKQESLGGRLCLDFTNTVSWHDSHEKAKESLTSYKKLIDWSLNTNILTNQQAFALLKRAENCQSQADMVLQQAIELRESIFRIFSSVSNQETPSSKDLSALNKFLADAYKNVKIVRTENKYSLEFFSGEEELDCMFSPIVESAINVLTSESDLSRVKKCEGYPCGLLFLDTSRNRSRRWCSMADCGNRAKAKRFYKNKNSN